MLDLMHLERLPVAEIKFVGGGASTFDEMVKELVHCARDDNIVGNKIHGPILVLWRMNDMVKRWSGLLSTLEEEFRASCMKLVDMCSTKPPFLFPTISEVLAMLPTDATRHKSEKCRALGAQFARADCSRDGLPRRHVRRHVQITC